jgi:hypothetical protein
MDLFMQLAAHSKEEWERDIRKLNLLFSGDGKWIV